MYILFSTQSQLKKFNDVLRKSNIKISNSSCSLYESITFNCRTITGHFYYGREGQQGLIDNYWSLESHYVHLKPHTEYVFGLTKRIRTRLNQNKSCIPEDEVKKKGYNYPRCVLTIGKDLLRENLVKNGGNLCWIPQADLFIKQMNDTSIEACRTRPEMKKMEEELYDIMSMSLRRIPSCLEPCTTEHIQMKQKENTFFTDNYTEIYFYWENLDVLIEEEYLLMDLNAIVSAVGGSLGLFLGFSCLDFLLKLLSRIELIVYTQH